MDSKILSSEQINEILNTLKNRFEKNMNRHTGLSWTDIQYKIEADNKKLRALYEMERTGGEPDLIFNKNTGECAFYDCSAETPKERRSLCYDREALNSRKDNKPSTSAVDIAADIGIDILNEEQYRELQKYGEFDVKTSSWVKTPESIRKLGGALFCDRRYDTIFVYHNGAESYYSSRGFRGILKV